MIVLDWNFGLVFMGDLLISVSIFGMVEKFSLVEVLLGIIFRGVVVLGLNDCGRLVEG